MLTTAEQRSVIFVAMVQLVHAIGVVVQQIENVEVRVTGALDLSLEGKFHLVKDAAFTWRKRAFYIKVAWGTL